MKILSRLICLAALLFLLPLTAVGAVGYVNEAFGSGDNWFGNPLYRADESLNALIPVAPNGATVSLWDPVGRHYTAPSVFESGVWSINYVLDIGTGALLHTPTGFTNTFVGTVYNFQHQPWDLTTPSPAPPFAGADGLYLFSSPCPVALDATSFPVFTYLIGRQPREGEQFTRLDVLTQTYLTTTFTGGVWSNGDPSLAVGEAALFNIGPVVVPEPSIAALGLLTLGAALCVRRSR